MLDYGQGENVQKVQERFSDRKQRFIRLGLVISIAGYHGFC